MATVTTTAITSVAEVHPEDVELIEELAKLQRMHKQIYELRTLLPDALLSPARDAIARPKQANPVKLATAISKAGQKGRSDIHSFTRDWHDPKTRQLFKEAKSANTPQGLDTWLVDYKHLIQSRTADSVPTLQAEDVPFDTVEEGIAVIDSFSKSDHNLKLHSVSDSTVFPIVAEVARMQFKVDRNEASSIYIIEALTEHTLAQQVAAQISAERPWRKLEELLSLVEAYHDIRLRKCDKCSNLLDDDFRYTIVRKMELTSAQVNANSTWLAYHKHSECAP